MLDALAAHYTNSSDMFRELRKGKELFLSADRTYNASAPTKRMTANYKLIMQKSRRACCSNKPSRHVNCTCSRNNP